MLIPLGAAVDLGRLQSTYTGQEQQSSTLILHSFGHPLMNVAQDISKLDGEKRSQNRNPETEALLRLYAITADDSKSLQDRSAI